MSQSEKKDNNSGKMQAMLEHRAVAIVTGASTGISLELAGAETINYEQEELFQALNEKCRAEP